MLLRTCSCQIARGPVDLTTLVPQSKDPKSGGGNGIGGGVTWTKKTGITIEGGTGYGANMSWDEIEFLMTKAGDGGVTVGGGKGDGATIPGLPVGGQKRV